MEMLTGRSKEASIAVLANSVMPALIPLSIWHNSEAYGMADESEMADMSARALNDFSAQHPIDLTVKRTPDGNRWYRTPSADSLITDCSMDEDLDSGESTNRGHRPRLPTADTVFMLKKYKRRPPFFQMPVHTSTPLDLSTKSEGDSSTTSEDRRQEAKTLECDDVEMTTQDNRDPERSSVSGCCGQRTINNHVAGNEQNHFDWSDYRRSMSCSQIDFRLCHRMPIKSYRSSDPSSMESSSREPSPSELTSYHDRDDGFHDETDTMAARGSSDIKSSPVKRLLSSDIKSSSGFRERNQDPQLSSKNTDTGRILMNEPPEAFVHTIQQLSVNQNGGLDKSQPSAFLQSLTDQYLPPYVNHLGTFPVDAYGYYSHLMHRLQAHNVLESKTAHNSTPNLSSVSPPHLEELSLSPDNGGAIGRKRSPRALTGRHVREGTGASPSTLVSLRRAIEERQRMKKTDCFDNKKASLKKKTNLKQTNVIRPRAYSATVQRCHPKDNQCDDDISVASD